MHVALTGASGHLGANLVRAMLDRGWSVRCLVRDDDQRPLQGLDVQTVRGDVCAPDTLEPLLEGVDAVFHCAALISISGGLGGRVWSTNVDGVRNMGRAARAAGVRRFVHVSSCHAFDLHADRVHEGGDRPGPHAATYDRSKAAGEAALQEIEGLRTTVLNPAGVLGPWDWRPSRMGRFLIAVRDRRLPAVVDGGFYFVDVRDVVDAVLRAAQVGRDGTGYLLGGHYFRIGDLARLAAQVAGVAPPRVVLPAWVAAASAPLGTAWARLTGSEPLFTDESIATLRVPPDNFDQSRARDELGFSPRPMRETLQAAYSSFERLGL